MDKHTTKHNAKLLETLNKHREQFVTSGTLESAASRELENLITACPNTWAYRSTPERFQIAGHIPLTDVMASAFLVDETTQRVVLLDHMKLNEWIQPGGHADGNPNLLQIAQEEAAEETTLTNLATPLGELPLYMAMHIFAANGPFKHPKRSIHVLYLCTTTTPEAAKLLETDKHRELRWFTVDEIFNDSRTNNNYVLKTCAERWQQLKLS